ncbi:ISAs1 family transposase [Saccharopolyspora shandongensis]|uniref:ISAs1 family transposase n=1 Tax=Saccharopolyspora shandongensis TaxID=418495 RepID=UPI003445C31C
MTFPSRPEPPELRCAVSVCVLIASARSYTAVGQWSANVPQHALARLGARTVGALEVRVAPSAATIRRIIGLVCPGQPGLHRQLRSLPWKDVTARRYNREIGHGRKETRATRALTVTDLGLDFPHAVQGVRILRHRTDLKTGTVSRQTVYAITDLTSNQASPQRRGQLARSQWTIENRLHFVRDTTFSEDASKIRTCHAPENMATLRNLAINTLRAAGRHNIDTGLRHVSYAPFNRLLDLLNIP